MFTCTLSVRELVEFLYTRGDLVSVSSSYERANLGSRIHRMLQAEATGDYQSEVYLKEATILEDLTIIVDGRADGIRKEENVVTIEEIKTTSIPYEMINDAHVVHFAQAYCYAYMYCLQQQLSTCQVSLIYYQIETKQIKTFTQQKTFDSLQTFYMDTLREYKTWACLSRDIRINSTTSLRQLQFPFDEYRPGQRQFAVAVYKSIVEGTHLFAQAPTGIGKTISTLFPALKAVGEQKIEKVFYLCAKNITASVAYDTINLLKQQTASFKSVAIIAKDKICMMEERNCDPDICPYAKGYFDRIKPALYEVLSDFDIIDKTVLQEKGKQHMVCPFELGLDASLYADVIICDYNYLFDPRVYLKRFFMEKRNYAFLVDEAHNLVDRARDMYSTQLSKQTLSSIKRLIPKDYKILHNALRKLIKALSTLAKECVDIPFRTSKEALPDIQEAVEQTIEHMDGYLQSEHDVTHDEDVKTCYFELLNYVRISEYYDKHFITCFWMEGKDFILRLFCMNPRNPLQATIGKGKATIFFSATLSPIDYYLSLLGGEEETRRLSLPSPFDPQQLCMIMNNRISTRYKDRNTSLIETIEIIHASILPKAGNYIVFLPSYAYMKQLADAFMEAYPEIQVSVQHDQMNQNEKQCFLDSFHDRDQMHIRFCVLGGMFSEGIDLKGDKLIGTIIIGVGLPQINGMQDLIRDHFDDINQMGYAYAYQFPGMNKVLQAAGRVIRSSQDKGIIVFIDDRFSSRFYKGLLPAHMRHYQIIQTPQQTYTYIKQFWEKT